MLTLPVSQLSLYEPAPPLSDGLHLIETPVDNRDLLCHV